MEKKTSIIVKACHKSLMTLTPLATTTEGVMYHLDFESLGQPLCKAWGGEFCMSIPMAGIGISSFLSLQWMGTKVVFDKQRCIQQTFEVTPKKRSWKIGYRFVIYLDVLGIQLI